MIFFKRKLIITLSLLSIFMSCDECRDSADCPTSALFEYTLIDSDNNNLFLTDNYNIDSIEISTFKKNRQITDEGVILGNTIALRVIEEIDSIVVDYGNDRKDVFTFGQLSTKKTECCGTFISDFSVSISDEIFCTQCSSKLWEIKR